MSKEKKRFGSSPAAQELRAKLLEIKAKKLLPRGYAKTIAEKLNAKKEEGEKLIDKENVYQVSGGYIYNEEIVDELLALAKKNKLTQQIAKAKDILS